MSPAAARGRRDRALLVLVALLVALVFLSLDLHYTGGELVLPLDDSYIYAQYARAIAEGHPFRYTPEAEPSTGATGLLYPFLLAPFHLVGLRGAALPAFMFLLNAVLFALSAAMVYEVAGGQERRSRALLAGGLVVASGPLAWGYLSGMEVGLFTTLWLALAVALGREGRAGRDRWSVGWASLLTLVRPEGLVWAGLLWLGLPFTAARRGRARTTRLVWLIPLAVGLVPVVVNLVLAGSLAPAAGRPKSPLYLPGHHLPTLVGHGVGYLVTVFKSLLTGTGGPEITGTLNRLDTWGFVAPFTLLVLLAGAVAAVAGAWRRREATPTALAAAWFVVALLWVAVTTGSAAHHFRYLLPVWPALALLAARGVESIASLFDREGSMVSRVAAFRGLGTYLVGYGALTVVGFALLFGQEAHGFGRQYLDTARWIDGNLPRDARVASLDAGILAYEGNRELFDLFGLTTPAMLRSTAFFASDAGTKYEVMERLPAEERPTHFALHDRRYDSGGRNEYAALIPVGEDGAPQIVRSTGVVIDVPVVGENMLVWPADWSTAHSGDEPSSLLRGRVVDRIDMADPVSEHEHDVVLIPEAPGFLGDNRVDRFYTRGGRWIVDGGRTVAGTLRFRLSGLTPGRVLGLRLRTVPLSSTVDLLIGVDGVPTQPWTLWPGEWPSPLESETFIPGRLIRAEEVEISLTGRFLVHHIWAIEDTDGGTPEAVGAASTGQGEPLRVFGALRAMMHEGATGSAVALGDLLPDPSLCAVGALSGLRGEVTVLGGTAFATYPEGDDGLRTESGPRLDEEAALLVAARVPTWRALPVEHDILFSELDDRLGELAASEGLDPGGFPFFIEGAVRELRWHVIDGARLGDGPSSHEEHRRAAVTRTEATVDALLLGFYSERAEGVFTHMGSSTHVHALLGDPPATGHVDHVVVPAGSVLRLPAPIVSQR